MLALVGRELCLFLRVDATRIPAGQRPGFVALAVRRAAPFADPDHDAYWHDGHAAVWYWSRERVRTLVDRPGQDIRYRAEPIFLGEPATGNAVELLALDSTGADDGGDGEPTNGIEARVWRNGQLVADRWWPRPPDGSAWRDFARGAGLDQSAIEPPPPTRAAMRTQPLSATGQRVALAGWFDRYRPLAIAAAPVLVLALLAWQVAGIARVAREARAVDTRIEELSAQLSRIIDARTQADASQRQVEALLALRAPASQVRPPYPPSKLEREEEAALRLRLSIDARGRVTAVEPVGSTDRVFLQAARRHLIANWRYTPATEDGRPVPSTTVITLRFELNG